MSNGATAVCTLIENNGFKFQDMAQPSLWLVLLMLEAVKPATLQVHVKEIVMTKADCVVTSRPLRLGKKAALEHKGFMAIVN